MKKTIILTLAAALTLTFSARAQYTSVNADFSVSAQYLPFMPQGGFTVDGGILYSWNQGDGWGSPSFFSAYNLTASAYVFKSTNTKLDGNGYGDPFGLYDPFTGSCYVGTYTDAGTSGMWRYNQDTGAFTKLGAFGSLYGADTHNGLVYASGLNTIWNGGYGQDNQIALYDLSGSGQHDVIIQTTGNSATCAVDQFGNVYYANYNGASSPGLYMWTAAQIDSVRADLGNGIAGGGAGDLFLTYDDGCFLTALPGGANGITVDDAGNVFVSVNGSFSGIVMWNDALANGYLEIADTGGWGWSAFLAADGDVLNGGKLYAGSTMFDTDFYTITYTGLPVPEPSTWALMVSGGVLLLMLSGSKSQITKLKSQGKSKSQIQNPKPLGQRQRGFFCDLKFGIWGFLGIWILLFGISAAIAQPVEIPQPPNPATGPYGGGTGGNPANWFNEPIPGFIGPDGVGKARLPAGLDDYGNPVYQNPNNYVNPLFVGWATSVVAYKPSGGVAQTWQHPEYALGPVTGDVMHVVSLGEQYLPYDVTIGGLTMQAPRKGQVPPYVNIGDPNRQPYTGDPANPGSGWSFVGYQDPGYITLKFSSPVVNGSGADFVVFENAFVSNYDIPDTGTVAGGVFAELAYVEVSTDGLHFARFPSVSLTANPVNRYGSIDPSNVYNLAGAACNAYGESWGTPFNLDDLLYDPYALSLIEDGFLNLDNIVYIKIVDIPGCGYYTDSLGNPIYDAWYTYGSGGFDLDAVGVIHNRLSDYGEQVGTQTLSLNIQPVPEPSTWALMVTGALLALLLRKSQITKPKSQGNSKSQIQNHKQHSLRGSGIFCDLKFGIWDFLGI